MSIRAISSAVLLALLLVGQAFAEDVCFENKTGAWCCDKDGLKDAVLVLEKKTGWLVGVQICQNGRDYGQFDFVSVSGVSKEKVWDLVDAATPESRVNDVTGKTEWYNTETGRWETAEKEPPYKVKMMPVSESDQQFFESRGVAKAAKEAALLYLMEDGIEAASKEDMPESDEKEKQP